MTHPIAKKKKHLLEIHNQQIQDDYHWLRGNAWPEKITEPEIISYLEAENSYFDSFIQPLSAQKEVIFDELKGRIKLEDQSTYIKKDNYYYYSRTQANKDYAIYCRKEGSTEAREEILLDVNKLAINKNFTKLGAFSVSPDHKFMAYSVDHTGGEKYTIKIFDLEKNEYLKDEISNTIGQVVWHENMAGFFYTPTDKNWRFDKVKYHNIGANSELDKLIFQEKDHLYSVSISKSSSKDYIFINISGHDNNEICYIKMDDSSFTPHIIKSRLEKVIYSVDHNGAYFYMHTNERAKNFHVLRTSSAEYEADDIWEVFILEDKNKYLSSFDLTHKYLLLNYKANGLPVSTIVDIDSKLSKIIKFPDQAFTASVYSTNFEENDIRVNYSSLGMPATTYQYNFDHETLSVLKTQEIPSGFNPKEYKVERIFAKNGDILVPISLFYKKSLFKKDGSNPLYLYGYGSYGISIPPSFKNSAVSLANRGFVYSIAHIRGGDDLGHDWYEAAKFLTKKRTFEDFIAVAEHLIASKYTSKGNIVIAGGSAGGMLIGNVINQRPELYRAAIAHVPFVDVLNTMLDEKLPLTPQEYKEWGDPRDTKYFDYIKSYCPYVNVKKQNYPHLLITAGLTDPRVGYWEAAKWAAKLRANKTDANLLLYKTNMEYGHQGASGRFDYLKEAADDLLFIMKVFEGHFNDRL